MNWRISLISSARILISLIILVAFYCLIVELPLSYEAIYNTGSLNDGFFLFVRLLAAIAVLWALLLFFQSPKTKRNIRFNILDLLLSVLCTYMFFSYFRIAAYNGWSVVLIELILFPALYLIVRNFNKIILRILIYLIVLSGIIQAIYGLFQLYGIYHSNHHLFNITGGFYNPGPYSGYLAGIWPIALTIYLFRNELPIVKLQNNKLNSFFINKIQTLSNITIKSKVFKFINKQIFKQDSHNTDIKSITYNIERFISNIIYNYIPLVCLMSILLALPATRSRAAWISVIVSSILIAIIKYTNKSYFSNFLNSGIKKVAIATIAILMIGGCFFWFYYLKKDSANGRMLIWKTTAQMIADKPITGFGFGKYPAHYMDYQADYLKGKENTEEAYLADEINYAYNTLLKLTTELGLIGFFLIALIFYFVFKDITKEKDKILISAKFGVLGLLIFSMFSYPEHILSIKILFTSLLAIVASQSNSQFLPILVTEFIKVPSSIFKFQSLNKLSSKKINLIPKMMLLLTIISAIYSSYPSFNKFHKAKEKWVEANRSYRFRAYNDCLNDYFLIYQVLSNNGQFLLNYGKALSMAKKHCEAIEILKETEKFLKNTIVYTAMGDSYKALKKFSLAEQAYEKANQMVPARFYSKYLLAKLYQETGQMEKAKREANEILNKKVKVQSTAIDEMKEEMRKVVSLQSTVHSPQSEKEL